MGKSETIVVNGWHLFGHSVFVDQLEALVKHVEKLREKNPEQYKEKNATKRLAAVIKLISKKIPEEPTLPEYRQGLTLGEEHKHWFRAKFFQQYRLFFRFHVESKIIIYAWVNDEETKRAYDNKSDAYAIFRKMLRKGAPPNNWDSLLKESRLENSRFKYIVEK